MSRRGRSIFVTLTAIAAIVLTPAVAMACRITNASPWGDHTADMYAWFSCGQHCGAYYHVKPGKSVSYPSTAGQVQACLPPGVVEDEAGYRERGTVQVDAGGEVRFKYNDAENATNNYGTKAHWDVYLADDDLYKSVDHQLDYSDFFDSTYCWLGSP